MRTKGANGMDWVFPALVVWLLLLPVLVIAPLFAFSRRRPGQDGPDQLPSLPLPLDPERVASAVVSL